MPRIFKRHCELCAADVMSGCQLAAVSYLMKKKSK